MLRNYDMTLTAIKNGHSFNNNPICYDGTGTPYELDRDALRHFCFVEAGYGADDWGKILWFKNKSSLTLIIDGFTVPPDHMYRDCIGESDVVPVWKPPQ